MLGFLLAFLATLTAGLGARDQAMVAQFAARHPGRVALIAAALGCTLATALAAGWAGLHSAPLLDGRTQKMLGALALGLAGIEMMVVQPRAAAKEPTQSLGAFVIVLLAQQLTDAARLMIFALSATSLLPEAAVAGGALGCCASIAGGWMAGPDLARAPLTTLRRILGLALTGLAAALMMA